MLAKQCLLAVLLLAPTAIARDAAWSGVAPDGEGWTGTPYGDSAQQDAPMSANDQVDAGETTNHETHESSEAQPNHDAVEASTDHVDDSATTNHVGDGAATNHVADAATPNHNADGATTIHVEEVATPNSNEDGATPSHGEEAATPNHNENGATTSHVGDEATTGHASNDEVGTSSSKGAETAGERVSSAGVAVVVLCGVAGSAALAAYATGYWPRSKEVPTRKRALRLDVVMERGAQPHGQLHEVEAPLVSA